MTCDERIEKLLNKAGQTISDLPKPQTASYAYSRSDLRKADTEATEWHGRLNSGAFDTADYILHLTDVIDRLEWALDNVTRERDYLKKLLVEEGCDCDICVYADVNGGEMPCYACDLPKNQFEYAGIPEDWRADNGTESDA